jgi:hypothetical protein
MTAASSHPEEFTRPCSSRSVPDPL